MPLLSTYESLRGANVARFIERARAGENLTITCLGDSILEGQTVTNPATDGAMILLAADLSTRYGITVTQTNRASSGYTALRAHINGNVATAIADAADLYIVSAFDKNDLGSDVYGVNAAGYPLAQSTAAVERIIRTIRGSVPKADIIVMSTNPYMAGSSSNPYQVTKDLAERRNAAAYGCEWVDVYGAFTALGDYSALMADTTHPNTAGHRLIADTILAHLTDIPRAPVHPGAVATTGLHSPEAIDTAAGANYGYVSNATPGAAGSVTYVTGGAGWASEVTTTAGAYVECTAAATELYVQISTTEADNTVVDIAIDGVTTQTDLNLSTTGGKKGTYWVPFAVGLSGAGASHTLRLTLKSGTLRTFATGALLSKAATFTHESRSVTLFGTPATVTMTTSYQDIGADTAISLPSGWTSMDIVFTGYLTVRNSGAMTAVRRFDYALRSDGTSINGTRQQNLHVAAATFIHGVLPLNGVKRGVTASSVSIDVIAKVDDATDTIQTTSVYLDATLIRAS